MMYLVTMELIGSPPTSPQDIIKHVEQKIIPTHEALIKLQAEKVILAGGDMSGRRGSAFIVNVSSNEELSKLLMSFPSWAMQKVEVTPLESFEDRQAGHHEFLDHMKKLL
ncbi:MAG: muconolactone Delta-isomerase family protein [Thermodesulfobacteriota bacterium]